MSSEQPTPATMTFQWVSAIGIPETSNARGWIWPLTLEKGKKVNRAYRCTQRSAEIPASGSHGPVLQNSVPEQQPKPG